MLDLGDMFRLAFKSGMTMNERNEFVGGAAQMQLLSQNIQEEIKERKITTHTVWHDHFGENWSDHD